MDGFFREVRKRRTLESLANFQISFKLSFLACLHKFQISKNYQKCRTVEERAAKVESS
jgi:hypothetical protein